LLATAFAFLALLSKESGIAIVVAIAAVELWPWPSKPALKRLAPLFALTALYLLLRAEALRKSAPDFALTPIERVLTVLETVGRYVFMTLDPWQPRTQIGLIKDPAYGFVALGVAGLAAACFFLWKTRKKWTKERFFAGVIVLLPLLLVIHVIPLPWLVVAADRLLYTPFAALAVAIAPGLGAVFPSRRLVTIGALALAASFAAATFRTTTFYLDPAAFWVRAVETTPPTNFLPTRNLAAEFARQGLYEDALALAGSVERRTDPTGVQHYPNFVRASLLVNLGRYAEAEALVDRTRAGGTADMDMQRAHLLANFKRLREARTIALDVLERHPDLGSATWLLRHIEQYEADRKKLTDPALSALDRAVITARAEIRVGRRVEGTLAWLALISDPKTPKAVVDEGMPVLIWFASFEHLRQAARAYRARPDPTPAVLVMLEQRELSAQRLIDAHPRIERALGFRFQR
jgi:hypothetical protein